MSMSEMKRILERGGRAYVSVARGPWSHVNGAGWEKIIEGFRVERRGNRLPLIAHRWAVVSVKEG